MVACTCTAAAGEIVCNGGQGLLSGMTSVGEQASWVHMQQCMPGWLGSEPSAGCMEGHYESSTLNCIPDDAAHAVRKTPTATEQHEVQEK
jgi:hypothetical protein